MSGWTVAWTWGDASGTDYVAAPQWSERAALFGSASEQARSVTLELRPMLPRSIGAHASQYPPWSATATLRRDGLPVITGQWVGTSYDEEVVAFTLSDSVADDAALIPSEGLIYDRDNERFNQLTEIRATWGSAAWALSYQILSSLSRRAVGVIGPQVYGAPGSAANPGSPAFIVDETSSPRRLMVARPHPVQASTVTVWGPGFDEAASGSADVYISKTYSVQVGVDDAGAPYAYVELPVPSPGNGDIAPSNSHDFFASWTGGEAQPGGAGSVLLSLLAQSTLRVDIGAWVRARPTLDRWRLAGFVSETVAPSALALEAILPILPVQIVYTADGIAPVIWPWLDGAPVQPEAALVAGPGFALAGRVQYLADLPTISVELGYAPDPQSGQMTGTVRVTPDTSPHAAAAARLVGTRGRVERLETSWVWDDATAADLCAIRARLGARPMRAIPYMADPDTYGPGGRERLIVGMPVTLSDSRLGLSAVEAVIGEIETDAVSMRVTVYLRDDPLGA